MHPPPAPASAPCSHLLARMDVTGTPTGPGLTNKFDTSNANNAAGNFLNVNRPNLKVLT